ncbi:MAG: hypothetical protein F4138_02490 [Acidimicrobiia bacterium]|nr:hypothetical protein [Acidimicrobiia bacterium]
MLREKLKTGCRGWFGIRALAMMLLLTLGASTAPVGGQPRNNQLESLEAKIAEQEMLIADRDVLIQAQEALLNTYRCMFSIDTELVPNGCPNPAQTDPIQPNPAQPNTTQPDPAPSPTATPTPSTTPLDQPTIPESTTAEQWEQLRQCNAKGNYQHVHPNQANFGVYEFRQSSWDGIARQHHPHLEGVNPSDAAPADQDRMAYLLFGERGWAPWPACNPTSQVISSGGESSEGAADLSPIPAGSTQAQWDHLINCESSGNYSAYNPAGPYLGAFQFLQSTWNEVARRNHPHLEGIDPRDAAPADQHRMAHALYQESGWQPWPACTAAFS